MNKGIWEGVTWEEWHKVEKEHLHKKLAELKQRLREEDSPMMKEVLDARIIKTQHQIKTLKYRSFQ